MFRRIAVATLLLTGCADLGDGSSTGQGPTEAPATTAASPAAAKAPEDSSVSALHILIAYQGAMRAPTTTTRSHAEAEVLAKSLISRLRNGESFSDLAHKYSDDTSSIRGGDVGSYTKDVARAPFDVLFTLKPGQIADVAETGYGFHIIERAP
jgi:parvulin-like peptidyl-prolyl isomerase